MDIEDVVYMYTVEYYSAIKRNEIMPFAATWMDLEIIILSKGSKQRERQIPYDITYTWNLKCDTDKLIYGTETDSNIENRLVVAKTCVEGSRGGMDWD